MLVKYKKNKINSTIGGKFGLLIYLQLQTWNNAGYWIIFSSHKFITIDLLLFLKNVNLHERGLHGCL